jgi:hypothetical protein
VRGINSQISLRSILYYAKYINALSKMRVVGVNLKNYDFCKTGQLLHELAPASSWRAGFWDDETRHGELLLATAS